MVVVVVVVDLLKKPIVMWWCGVVTAVLLRLRLGLSYAEGWAVIRRRCATGCFRWKEEGIDW